jgi:hypothetical protein
MSQNQGLVDCAALNGCESSTKMTVGELLASMSSQEREELFSILAEPLILSWSTIRRIIPV